MPVICANKIDRAAIDRRKNLFAQKRLVYTDILGSWARIADFILDSLK